MSTAGKSSTFTPHGEARESIRWCKEGHAHGHEYRRSPEEYLHLGKHALEEYCPTTRKTLLSEVTLDNKRIDHIVHEDGRKDVHVRVNTLDVPVNTPEDALVKEKIEKELLPKLPDMLAAAMVRVVVLHHGTELRHAEHDVPLNKVRAYAEQVVKAFRESFPAERWMRDQDFTIVEVHHDSYTTRVTTLSAYER